jgi:hypothetical protein
MVNNRTALDQNGMAPGDIEWRTRFRSEYSVVGGEPCESQAQYRLCTSAVLAPFPLDVICP